MTITDCRLMLSSRRLRCADAEAVAATIEVKTRLDTVELLRRSCEGVSS